MDQENEFQRLLAREAETAAARVGFALETRAAGMGGYALGAQLRLVDGWLDSEAPPQALLVLAARDRGLARTVRSAARRGVHWIALNRTEDDLEAIRQEFPQVVVATVCPDETATGRLQGRLVRTVLPQGGCILYVTGHSRTLTSRDRAAALKEALADGPYETVSLEAGWSAAEAYQAAGGWLRIALRARRQLDAIVCQSDTIAEGTLRAWEQARSELGRHDLRPPVIGCDGTPGFGQAMVADGRLTATVVLPRAAATAVSLLATTLDRGTPMPPLTSLAGWAWPETLLKLPASA
ncbi:MAG TPA: substrate-binding domain-containing protein [Vicinamibacteria bacterium]|nr:substrate-binding domain-containing protein [Vicinamibacteria bacterium]